MKSVLRDEMENFRIRGDGRLWQILQRPENNVPLPQIAQSQLTDYEGMTEDLTVVEQVAAPCPWRGGGEPRRKCRRGSRRLAAPSCGEREIGFAAAQAGQPPRAFTLDQGLERLAHERGFFPQTGKSLRFRRQVVIERQRGTHRTASA